MKKITTALSLTLALLATTASAFNPQPEPPPSSLPISIGWDQDVTVHVANVIDLMRAYFPETGADESCAVELSVYEADGRAVVIIDNLVGPGQIESIRLYGSELGLGRGERGVVRASVRFTGGVSERIRCQATTRSTLEVVQQETGILGAVLEIPTTWVSGIEPQPF